MNLTKTQKEILRAWPNEGHKLLTATDLAQLPVNGARSINETANIIDRLKEKGICKPGVTHSTLPNGRTFENVWLTIEGLHQYAKVKTS